MNKLLFTAAIMCVLSGCLLYNPDDIADDAAENYLDCQKPLPEKALSLSDVLKLQPQKTPEIRLLFARMHVARQLNDRAGAEICRIKLNEILDYLPGAEVRYECSNALDCPAELPTVDQAEKAALIIDDEETPVIELSAKVRICHAEAVRAMQDTSSPSAKLNYFEHCMKLARIIGVDLPDLANLREYERRFDSALKWRKKLEL